MVLVDVFSKRAYAAPMKRMKDFDAISNSMVGAFLSNAPNLAGIKKWGKSHRWRYYPAASSNAPLFIITVCCHMETYIQNMKQVDGIMNIYDNICANYQVVF